jgi:L-fucose mutarotase
VKWDGDQIVLADANFPVESIGKESIVIRADGHRMEQLLEAILILFPLDKDVEKPIF